MKQSDKTYYRHKGLRQEAMEIDELFQYLEIYRDSLSNDKEIENAQDLLTYYENNRNELIPYQEQGLDVMKNLPMIT